VHRRAAGGAVSAPDSAFVFNIVWTGRVFPYLKYFVASQMAQSDARFRFISNGCPPEQITLMEEFAGKHADRIVEVFVAAPTMEAHGVALDMVRAERDDGDYFCLIDPDIIATAPFVGEFSAALAGGCSGVTSGRGVWNDDLRPPEGSFGVAGEHFYSRDGFLFGSPHFAMYHRDAIEDTMARWNVGFRSAGPELDAATKTALLDAGPEFRLFDTGKIVNALLQIDGRRLCHFEHDALLHVGGVSHYLSPPEHQHDPEGHGKEPELKWPWPAGRLEVARFTGQLLRNLVDGKPVPAPPAVDSANAEQMRVVEGAIFEMMQRYRDM
jgi:hypothetical protein